MKRIGVLTGGGDVPGLNPCIKNIVYRAIDEGYEVVGIRKGWGGLLYCNPEDPQSLAEYIVPLDKQRVRTIDRTGGTFLHTSRTNPGKGRASKVPAFLKDKMHPDDKGPFDFTPHVLQVLDKALAQAVKDPGFVAWAQNRMSQVYYLNREEYNKLIKSHLKELQENKDILDAMCAID